MGSLKNRGDVKKIQTMLFKIGLPFMFVPFKLHI